jgi:uncharacterized phage infection (PIP) family protein YhgE
MTTLAEGMTGLSATMNRMAEHVERHESRMDEIEAALNRLIEHIDQFIKGQQRNGKGGQ